MRFVYQHLLWLVPVLGAGLIAFFWWSNRKREQLMRQFIQARLLPALTVGISLPRRKLKLGLLVIAVSFLVMALARPQWGFKWEEARLRGLDIVVAIDTSKSMLAEDVPPTRLTRAKLAAFDLVQQAKSDRLGLVAFAGSAFLQCPLTIDEAAFRQSVDTLDVGIIPDGGTALGEAIKTALTAFKEGDNHKVLVMFTDGEDQDSGAVEAARKAAESGLKIYTIGIGTPEGELLRVRDNKGRTDYIRDEQGNVVKSHLNEELLRQVAGETDGGFYLPLRGAKTIETLYKDGLSRLPKADRQERLLKRYHEQYHWPLAAALVLLLIESLFPERARVKISSVPQAEQKRRIAAEPAPAIAVILLMLFPMFVTASPPRALRDYKSGNYTQSLKEYEELLQRKSDDPRLHFNAGAAAYKNKQYDQAAKQFGEALNSPDLKLQELGYYNRGNALYYLGKGAPDPAKRAEAWKKSLQDFESSVKLNPKDQDASFNRELVKKRLEELQQQQQQQQSGKDQKDQDKQSDQQKKENQNSKPDQDQKQEQQNADKSEQDKEQQEQAQKSEEKQQQQQQAQQQEQSQQQQAQAQQGEKKDQQQPAPAQGKEGDQKDEQQQDNAPAAPGQMTPQEARQLLDSQKDEERALPIKPSSKAADRAHPLRDW